MSAYRTYAFTIRPCDGDDLQYWGQALNKYCNCERWFGAIEVKRDEEGDVIEGSQHIHVAMLLRKPIKRDVVVKWVCRNSEGSKAGKELGNAHIKVNRTGIKIMYSWDWVESYMQGKWMEEREPVKEDREEFELHFPKKGDTGAKTTRTTKPSVPDRIVELWKRDYPDMRPSNGSTVLKRYVKYLMYNTKEIPLIKPRELSDVLYHVAEMITPPEMPEPQSCESAPWFVKGVDDGLVC